MAPLVLWGLGELLAAAGEALATVTVADVVTTGVVVGTGVTATKIVSDAMAKAEAEDTLSDADPDEPCPECCDDKKGEIYEAVRELKERHEDMRVDENDLSSDPGRVFFRPDGSRIGSWDGHVQQFKQKQQRLKRLLKEFYEEGCKSAPPDADSWSNTDAPSGPRPDS